MKNIRTIKTVTIVLAIALAIMTGYTFYLNQKVNDKNNSIFTVAGKGIDQNELNTLTVSGFGSAKTKPDVAILWIGVKTEADSASDAVRDNSVKMKSVISALKRMGISDDRIETENYNLYPNYDWERSTVVGYTVINELKARISSLEALGEIIDSAVASGANQIYNLQFALSDEEIIELKNQALQNAVQNAQLKACAISQTLGVTITRVVKISENTFFYEAYRGDNQYIGEASSTPIIPGEFEVTATVQIVYSFS